LSDILQPSALKRGRTTVVQAEEKTSAGRTLTRNCHRGKQGKESPLELTLVKRLGKEEQTVRPGLFPRESTHASNTWKEIFGRVFTLSKRDGRRGGGDVAGGNRF